MGKGARNRNLRLIQHIGGELARREGITESAVAQSFTAYLLSAVLGEAIRLNGGQPIVLPRDWANQVTERGLWARTEMREDGYHVSLEDDYEQAVAAYVAEGWRGVRIPDARWS